MSEKTWTQALGEPGQNPEDTGELLKQTSDKRKRREIERQDELDDKKHAADIAKLDKEEKTAEAEAEKVGQKGSSQSGVEIKGSVNLGDLDLQKQQDEAKAELKRLKEEQDESIQRLGQQNEQLRDKIHEQEMEVLKVTFTGQMDTITRALESSRTSQKSLADMLTEARETAKAIGMGEPQSGGDAMVQIELKKLDFDHQVALRRMSRDEKLSDREFQLQLRRFDDDREQRKLELEQQSRSQQMWANAPAQVGAALGKAILDAEGEPEPQRPQSIKTHRLEVNPGEEGVIPCPSCENPVGIGPTARTAECVECGDRFTIKRVEKQE